MNNFMNRIGALGGLDPNEQPGALTGPMQALPQQQQQQQPMGLGLGSQVIGALQESYGGALDTDLDDESKKIPYAREKMRNAAIAYTLADILNIATGGESENLGEKIIHQMAGENKTHRAENKKAKAAMAKEKRKFGQDVYLQHLKKSLGGYDDKDNRTAAGKKFDKWLELRGIDPETYEGMEEAGLTKDKLAEVFKEGFSKSNTLAEQLMFAGGKYDETVMKGKREEQIPKFTAAYEASQNLLEPVGRALELINQVPDGLTGQEKNVWLKERWASPEYQELLSVISNLVLERSKELKGAISEGELKFLKDTVANERFSTEANVNILRRMGELLQRSSKKALSGYHHFKNEGSFLDWDTPGMSEDYSPIELRYMDELEKALETTGQSGYQSQPRPQPEAQPQKTRKRGPRKRNIDDELSSYDY